MDKRSAGRQGEDRACEALKKGGLKIIERNFSCPFGEIDIIAREKKTLVFVEVKARASQDYGEPSEAVTRTKRRRILRTAEVYMQKHDWDDKPVRFDIVEVLPQDVRHIRDAFDGSALRGRY